MNSSNKKPSILGPIHFHKPLRGLKTHKFACKSKTALQALSSSCNATHKGSTTQQQSIPIPIVRYAKTGKTSTPFNLNSNTSFNSLPQDNDDDNNKVEESVAECLPKAKSQKLGHKPFKMSAHELVHAISMYQVRNGTPTPNKSKKLRSTTPNRTSSSSVSSPVPSSPSLNLEQSQQQQNKIGLSSIIEPSGIKTKFKTLNNTNKHRLFSPRHKLQEGNLTTTTTANTSAVTSQSQYRRYALPSLSYCQNINEIIANQERQESVMKKLPKPFITTRQRLPRPSSRGNQRLKSSALLPPHLVPKYNGVGKRLTLSSLRSSRVVQQVPIKDMPTHLRYGNFTAWLWPTVCARLPSSDLSHE